MIALAMLAASVQAVSPAEDTALATCLAQASNTSEYRDVPSEELATHEEFLDDAEGRWCSDETMPYWSVAHREARAELGLPPDGLGTQRQQELAVANLRRMLAEAWPSAAELRDDPPPLSDARFEHFMLVWTLDAVGDDTALGRIAAPTIACTADALRAHPDGQQMIAGLAARRTSEQLEFLKAECGYGAIVEQLAETASRDIPGRQMDTYRELAGSVLSTLLFYAAIAQRN